MLLDGQKAEHSSIECVDLGCIDYDKALNFQLESVEQLYKGGRERIIFCSHPSVVTLGKKGQATDILGWKGPVVKIARGGKATYHGPGQIVAYPILNLKNRNCDIHKLLRALELSMIQTLREYGIEGKGHTERATGVWVNGKKVASIGIAVRRWITYHGLAINIEKDPLAFQGISPCGFQTQDMTCLEEIIGRKVCKREFQKKLQKHLLVYMAA